MNIDTICAAIRQQWMVARHLVSRRRVDLQTWVGAAGLVSQRWRGQTRCQISHCVPAIVLVS